MPEPGSKRGGGVNVGCVSYLNAKPLIWSLEDDFPRGVRLMLDVPSRLLEGMRAGTFDAALLPVIDYQRMAGLKIIPSGGIGCDGPTLTVRIFSRVPPGDIRVLACDGDSHTSVALARVVLGQRYGIRPEFTAWHGAAGGIGDGRVEACLLIGDKVVCQEPQGFPHQLDLGAQWKEMTGLPFVFAVWMARDGKDLGDLPERLEHAKCQGLRNVEEIVRRHAMPRAWPEITARRYLTEYLRYDIGQRELEAINLFYRLCAQCGALEPPLRDIELYS